MPRATVTSRELKNKDSGLDLFVTSFSEQKGIMTSIVHYQVVLVTNLSCFKLPSHKETDVVQYSLDKKLMEFEELRAKISELFPGTVLPTINKVSMIVNDMVLRERRNSLDHLVKFLASVPKLATCVPLLEFLGVDATRSKNFSPGEHSEGKSASSVKEKQGKETPPDEGEADFFQEDNADQEDSDLFKEEKGIFEEREERISTHVQMFEEQDLKRDLTEDDEKDFGFISDAIITKKETFQVVEEDTSDLFQLDDDLDQLMKLDLGKKRAQQNSEQLSPSPAPTSPTTPIPPTSSNTPATSTKPTPRAKPTLPPNKPKLNSPPANDSKGTEQEVKPVIPAKPTPAPRTKMTSQNSDIEASKSTSLLSAQPGTNISESLDQDDILKYLQDNLSSNTDDVDLFS